MNRLTRKEYKHLIYSPAYYNKKQISKFDEVYHKLGKIEDLMEENNINNIEELKEIIQKGIGISIYLETEWKKENKNEM